MGKKVQVLDIETGIVYESKEKASLTTKIGWHQILTYKLPNGQYKFVVVKTSSLANKFTTIQTSNIQFDISLVEKKQETTPSPKLKPSAISQSHNEVCTKVWGLEKMNLIQECSDFYVLYDLTIDHSEDAFLMSIFNSTRKHLAQQFVAYLDMAIGGELRHCKNLGSFFQEQTGMIWESDRKSAWAAWKPIRDNQGINALKTAYQAFATGKWGLSYGGKSWAKAVEVLMRYLSGEDTETMFVDTVWSLQHNTTYILSKFWDIGGLATILDRKFNGYIKSLVTEHKCSLEVAQIYKELHHEIL